MPLGRGPDRSAEPAPGRPAGVVLAGGVGSRLGGVDKPALTVAGHTLLDLALTALTGVGATPVVVVGPPRDLPSQVRQTREDPPGGGPAAAVAAALAALTDVPDDRPVVLLAADLPALTARTVDRLVTAVGLPVGDPAGGTHLPRHLPRGVVLVDGSGVRQYLLGAYRSADLRAAVGARRSAEEGWTGRPLRELLDPLIDVELPVTGDEAADIDTPGQLRRWSATE